MTLLSWGEFADASPRLAERGARLLSVGVAYIATTAKDGSPRVHPFTPLIGGGRLLAFIAKHTVKYGNLLRDPRYAIHAMLGKDDEEFMIIGRAVVSDDWATSMLAAVEARKINMTSKQPRPLRVHDRARPLGGLGGSRHARHPQAGRALAGAGLTWRRTADARRTRLSPAFGLGSRRLSWRAGLLARHRRAAARCC